MADGRDDTVKVKVVEVRATAAELEQRRRMRKKALRKKLHSQKRPSGLPMASHLEPDEKREAVDLALEDLAKEETASRKTTARRQESIRELAAEIRAQARVQRRRTSQAALKLGVIVDDEDQEKTNDS